MAFWQPKLGVLPRIVQVPPQDCVPTVYPVPETTIPAGEMEVMSPVTFGENPVVEICSWPQEPLASQGGKTLIAVIVAEVVEVTFSAVAGASKFSAS